MSALQDIIAAVESGHDGCAALEYSKGAHSTGEGDRYEERALALVFLRCVKRRLHFQLSSNNDDAGKFDDLVLVWRPEGHHEARALLVQLKHKTSERAKTVHRATWLSEASNSDFGLYKYCTSYRKISSSLKADGLSFVLLTNARLADSCHGMFVSQDDASVPGVKLLRTGGALYRLNPDDEEVWKAVRGDTGFADRFYLLCEQRNSEEILADIYGELEGLLGAGELCGQMCDSLCKSLREWMNTQNVCLSSRWSKWQALVDEYIRKEVTGCREVTTRLRYNCVQGVQNYVVSCNPAWVRPPEKGTEALTATKVHQALGHQTHIMISVECFRVHRRKVLRCWGPFCRWLVLVDDDKYETSDILPELTKQIPSDCHLVIVSMRGNNGFADTCQSCDVTDDSWNECLDINIRLNGDHYECHLRDLVGSADALKSVLDGCPVLLLALARLSQPLRMGQELQALPSLYSPGKLVERRLAGVQFFSSMGQRDVCVTDRVSYSLLSHEIGGHTVVTVAEMDIMLTPSETEWPVFVLIDNLEMPSIRETCRKWADWNIFVVQFSNDVWEILYMRGTSDRIRDYVTEQEKEQLQTLDVASNIVIVEGRPGVGKSTMLSYVGKQVKCRDPACWLLRVNLLDFYTVFDHSDSGASTVEDILLRAAFNNGDLGKLEYALLSHVLLESVRVVCLVDGFDEVCPDYTDKCLAVLPLLTPRRGKLVVTTRPAQVTVLERQMGVLAHSLRPFSDSQLHEFFTLYTCRGNVPSISGLKKSVRDLVRVPLFAKMYVNLAEEGTATHDIVTLYEAFFRNKFRRLYEEKWGDNLSAPGKRRDVEEARKRHEEQLMLFAVLTLVRSANVPVDPSFDTDIFIKAGIVYEFADGKPTFLHRTFAEHFLAKWCFLVRERQRVAVYREAYIDGSLEFFLESFSRMTVRGRPLLVAVLDGDQSDVGALLVQGADPGEVDDCGRNTLHLSVIHGVGSSLLLLQLCRHSGEEAMFTQDGLLNWTPLRYAAEGRRWLAVKTLLEAGDDVRNLGDFQAGLHHPGQLQAVFDEGGYQALFQHVLQGNRPSVGGQAARWCTTAEGRVSAEIEFAVSLVCASMPQDWLDLITEKAMEEGHVEVHNLLLRTHVHLREEEMETDDLVAKLKAKDNRADRLRIVQSIGQPQTTEGTVQAKDGDSSSSQATEVPSVDGPPGAQMESGGDTNESGWTDLHNVYLVGSDRGAMLFINGGTSVQCQTVSLSEKCSRLLVESGGQLRCLSVTEGPREMKFQVVPTQGELEEHPAISSLHNATAVGDANVLRMLIDIGKGVNERNKQGFTPLHYATCSGSAECISLLVGAGSDVLAKSSDGATALHLAARRGYVDSVRLLLSSGSELDSQNSDGDTPLMCAASSGNVECTRLLLDAGADVHVIDSRGDTALCSAAGGGEAECVALLVAAGANVNIRDSGGYTPVHFAAVTGSEECLKLLADAGANVRERDNQGYTPLHYAAVMGNTDCVRLLVQFGACMNECNSDGATPLHNAAQGGHVDCVRLLIDAGCDVTMKNSEGCTPLHCAARDGHAECVKLLLGCGSDALAQSADGSTPLHYAALCSGSAACIRHLLSAGASLTTLDGEGGTPLHCAAANGNVECTTLLVDAGSDVHTRDSEGYTALHFAALNGNVDCVVFLLTKGAEVEAQTVNGDTPLHRAAGKGHANVITVLLRAGASVVVKNSAGKTAQQVAQEEGHVDCVEVLLQGAKEVASGDDDDVHSRGFLSVQNTVGKKLQQVTQEEGNVDGAEVLLQSAKEVGPGDDDDFHSRGSLAVEVTVGKTSQQVAQEEGNVDCVEALLQGAEEFAPVDDDYVHSRDSLSVQNKAGKTSQQVAQEEGNVDCKKFLLQSAEEFAAGDDDDVHSGGFLVMQNRLGKTSQQLVQGKGNVDCVTLLLEDDTEEVAPSDDFVHSRSMDYHTNRHQRWLCSLL